MAYVYKHADRPLDGITIQRAVGRGGFGEVYYALTDSGKQVALKYLRENPDVELRGISHVMNLKSPHLITIYDVRHNADNEPIVVMEYVGGPSLRDVLVDSPEGLPLEKVSYFVDGIARGLQYLHDRGIVHRDLKPGNIFYDDGYVKIGDYGLSKHISVSKHSGQTVSVGTVHYMAPEIGSGSYTKAIDVYALGVILYEMITGRLPFTGSSMGEVLMRHLNDKPNVSNVPAPFDRIITRAMAKDPSERYQDAGELLEELREFSGQIASFDHSIFSSVPRTESHDGDSPTVTMPPRVPPVPVLDAREIIGREPPEIGGPGAAQRRAVPRGGGGIGGLWRGFTERLPQMITLVVAVFALSIGMAMFRDGGQEEATAVALGLYMTGATIGSLFAYLGIVRRNKFRNAFLDRVAFAGIVFLFMLPGVAVASEACRGDAMFNMIIPIMAIMVLFNWFNRIDEGRKGEVSLESAFYPAIMALPIAGIADAEVLYSVFTVAAISMLTQATATLFPRRKKGGAADGEPAVAAAGGDVSGWTWKRTVKFPGGKDRPMAAPQAAPVAGRLLEGRLPPFPLRLNRLRLNWLRRVRQVRRVTGRRSSDERRMQAWR